MTTTKHFIKRLPAISFLFILLLLSAGAIKAQVIGCTDRYANNYDPIATVNDGSCSYNTTNYTPVVKVDQLDNLLEETSGLQWADNSLWTLNDAGGSAAIYRIDTVSSAILQTVTLSGASNVDWEDIAFDGSYFYIGDFGNNANGARTDLKIYKFPISAIPPYASNPDVTIPAQQIETINFTYINQPQPPAPVAMNTTRFDCEAMIVDAGKIHLFSKNWVDANTTHYVINSTASGTYTATALETLATSYLVTGADKAVGQELVALIGYQASGTGNHFMHLLSGYGSGNYFNGNNRRIDLPNVTIMGQAEAITFKSNSYGYISNEKFSFPFAGSTFTINQKLRSFDISSFASGTVLPVELKTFTVANLNGMHKLSWSFSEFVQDLQVQHSTNGIHFSDLKTFNRSSADHWYNSKINTTDYYRLAWRKNNAATVYSAVILLKKEEKSGISNMRLKLTGELSFKVNGTSPAVYSFKVFSTDGKPVSYINARMYNVGINSVQLLKNTYSSRSVVVTVYPENLKSTSSILRIE